MSGYVSSGWPARHFPCCRAHDHARCDPACTACPARACRHEGEHMFSLAQAAKATGKSRPTIARAIKNGRLSASRADDGSYEIDPAELSRVFPLAGQDAGTMKQTVPGNGAGTSPAISAGEVEDASPSRRKRFANSGSGSMLPTSGWRPRSRSAVGCWHCSPISAAGHGGEGGLGEERAASPVRDRSYLAAGHFRRLCRRHRGVCSCTGLGPLVLVWFFAQLNGAHLEDAELNGAYSSRSAAVGSRSSPERSSGTVNLARLAALAPTDRDE